MIKKIFKSRKKSTIIKLSGFTLAEMMIVLLILSIVMAAFAPVMTTRSKVNQSSPWKYTVNNSDAYYGVGASQTAMIGQPKAGITDNAKLVINVTDTLNERSHILLKRNNDLLGRIFIKGNNLIFGNNMQNLTGDFNTIIGKNALLNNISGSGNTAIGYQALKVNNNTNYNTAIGSSALTNTKGSNNTAIGYGAMTNGTGASSNVAIGSSVMTNVSSSNSVGIGSSTMSNAGGSNNIAIGTSTLKTVSGSRNLAIGQAAMGNATVSGSDNIGFGHAALSINTSGSNNIALGNAALSNNKTGRNNVAIGNSALSGNSSYNGGTNNIAIGTNALSKNTISSNNIALGQSALNNTTSGTNNIAIGTNALYNNTIGTRNIALGLNTMNANTLGIDNIAIGWESQGISTTGTRNISLGRNSLVKLKTGYDNTAIGYLACQHVTGSNKTCIGRNSGPKSGDTWATDSVERIFIGGPSKFNNGAAVLEIHNQGDPISGFGTKDSTVVINGNLLVKGGVITTLWRKNSGNNDNVNLYGRSSGQLEPFYPAGAEWLHKRYGGTDVKGRFRSFLGSSNTIYPSDARLKYIGKESTSGLDKIKELKVFNYTLKKDEKKTPRVGVIAQDLQKIFPDAVFKDEDGYLQIRMEDIFYAIVNAVKQLDAKITALINKDKSQDDEIKALKEQNEKLLNRNKALEARLLKLEQKLK